MKIDQYLKKLKDRRKGLDISLIKKAFLVAQEAHQGQKRRSGEDYIHHPISVSLLLADLQLDSETIAAGLLHDTLEDSDLTREDLEKIFPKSVVLLVEGVTTLGKVDFDQYWRHVSGEKDQEIESLRKLFLAIAEDIRVVFIKLADRLHNMRTLSYLDSLDQKRIAKETLDVFAPLADRMGMGQIKAELEDLAFEFFMPEEFESIKNQISPKIKEAKSYSPRIKKFLSNTLTQEKIKFKLDGRTKHLYSTYKKLKKYDGDINKIYDVVAFRIIVSSIPDCYRVLGIVHSNFKPLIGKIKDYIAVPKPNGYRSLHTTVFGLDGVITEIQIRTEKMHEEAENGLASHWKYSEKKAEVFERGAKVQASDREQKVINELKEAIKFDGLTPNVALDLFPDKIFVFSPKGDIYELREGSTPIDFAYAIHSSIAEKCIGCKVNEKIVPLDTKLENCDIVEVITAKNSFGPSRDWLFFVATAGAKQKIRAFLRRQDKEKNIQTGIEVLTEELRFFNKEFDEVKKKDWEEVLSSLPQKTLESLLSAIGNGDVSGSQIAKKICSKDKIKIVKKKKKGRPRKIPGIEGTEGVKIFFPSCCEPRSSDRIIGFITKGSGIAIHKEDCKNIEREDIQRLIEVKWEKFPTKDIKFIIKARDRKGLLKEIISVITSLDVFIKEMKTTTKSRGISAITFKAELDSGYKRKILKMRLLEVTDILSVETVG